MEDTKFSYNEYSLILKLIKPRLSLFKLSMPQDFVLMRHDVEFDISRAYEIAKIESEYGARSTFFFQVLSSAYNPFSTVNKNIIREIKDLGHDVGLHFYVTHIKDGYINQLHEQLNTQKTLFEEGLNMDCNSFSYHRPPKWVLDNRNDEICGMINAYGRSFFEFSPNPKEIIYLADSQHKWTYGHPIDHLSSAKIQILTHPDEWTLNGDNDNKEYFSNIIKDHTKNFIETLDNETKHFNKHKKFFS